MHGEYWDRSLFLSSHTAKVSSVLFGYIQLRASVIILLVRSCDVVGDRYGFVGIQAGRNSVCSVVRSVGRSINRRAFVRSFDRSVGRLVVRRSFVTSFDRSVGAGNSGQSGRIKRSVWSVGTKNSVQSVGRNKQQRLVGPCRKRVVFRRRFSGQNSSQTH